MLKCHIRNSWTDCHIHKSGTQYRGMTQLLRLLEFHICIRCFCLSCSACAATFPHAKNIKTLGEAHSVNVNVIQIYCELFEVMLCHYYVCFRVTLWNSDDVIIENRWVSMEQPGPLTRAETIRSACDTIRYTIRCTRYDTIRSAIHLPFLPGKQRLVIPACDQRPCTPPTTTACAVIRHESFPDFS